MAYRNKTYVCFDGDTDINHYFLMKAWKANDKIDFNFHDAHDLKTCKDSSTEETIKRSLRDRMNNSKLFIVLVGENTKNLYKFVRWEMDVALMLDIPIIVVNLNGLRTVDNKLCPPILKDKLAIHVSFNLKIVQHAIDTWGSQHAKLKSEGVSSARIYPESLYKELNV